MAISIFTENILLQQIVSFRRLRPGAFVLILLLAIFTDGMCQEYNYARLALLYGSNIPFNFNSVRRYTEGIEIEDGTILGITLVDSAQAGTDLEGFDLFMRTFNGATEILGEAYSLDLNAVRIRADNYLGFAVGFTSDGYQDLAATWTRICSYTDPDAVFDDLVWTDHQVSISYDCGIPVADGGNGSLLGEAPDYYQVEVEIELVPTGLGF